MYKLIVEGYDLIYIGHTCDELCKRLYRHKKSKDCGSKSLFDMGIVKIILIEKYPCLDMDEARRREQELIDEYKDICVNIRRAHCSNEHIPEYNKQYRLTYREGNKDKIDESNKQYRANNKDKIQERNKQYRENNKDKTKERDKQYRENNKDKIQQYRENNKDKTKERNRQYLLRKKEMKQMAENDINVCLS